MDSKIKLTVRIIIVVLLIALALIAAKGISNMAAKQIVAITPYSAAMPQNANTNANTDDSTADDGSDVLIYNRNLFNQKAGAEEAEPEPEKTDTTPEEEALIEEIAGDSSRPVLTDLRISLKGTQVASDSAYSIAMIMPLEGGNDARMLYLQEGNTLLSEAEILKIVRNRVYMKRITQNDRLEYIDVRTTEEELDEAKKNLEKIAEKAAEKEKAAAAAAAAAETAKNNAAAASGELVKKVGTDTYQVSKETVETIRKNPKELQRNTAKYGPMPKVQPVYKGGNIGGFRLLGVESDSVYAQLGLKSGDTILNVNGTAIEGPQQAMALLDAFNGEDVILKINRSGQEKTLTFQLK